MAHDDMARSLLSAMETLFDATAPPGDDTTFEEALPYAIKIIKSMCNGDGVLGFARVCAPPRMRSPVRERGRKRRRKVAKRTCVVCNHPAVKGCLRQLCGTCDSPEPGCCRSHDTRQLDGKESVEAFAKRRARTHGWREQADRN